MTKIYTSFNPDWTITIIIIANNNNDYFLSKIHFEYANIAAITDVYIFYSYWNFRVINFIEFPHSEPSNFMTFLIEKCMYIYEMMLCQFWGHAMPNVCVCVQWRWCDMWQCVACAHALTLHCNWSGLSTLYVYSCIIAYETAVGVTQCNIIKPAFIYKSSVYYYAIHIYKYNISMAILIIITIILSCVGNNNKICLRSPEVHHIHAECVTNVHNVFFLSIIILMNIVLKLLRCCNIRISLHFSLSVQQVYTSAIAGLEPSLHRTIDLMARPEARESLS